MMVSAEGRGCRKRIGHEERGTYSEIQELS